MATDYDALRQNDEDVAEDSLEELQTRSSGSRPSDVETDETETESFELPGADLSGEELHVQVVPPAEDEFTCSSCFLVRHKSQMVKEEDGRHYCRECQG